MTEHLYAKIIVITYNFISLKSRGEEREYFTKDAVKVSAPQ